MISTALRTARPLPQLTPVLLEQFLRAQQGLDVLQPSVEDESSLPRSVTIETLEDEQYMCASTCCGKRGSTDAGKVFLRRRV